MLLAIVQLYEAQFLMGMIDATTEMGMGMLNLYSRLLFKRRELIKMQNIGIERFQSMETRPLR